MFSAPADGLRHRRLGECLDREALVSVGLPIKDAKRLAGLVQDFRNYTCMGLRFDDKQRSNPALFVKSGVLWCDKNPKPEVPVGFVSEPFDNGPSLSCHGLFLLCS